MSHINQSINSWNYLHEGLWEKIRKLFTSGNPNDPNINSKLDEYYKKLDTCARLFPHSGTKISIPTGRKNESGDFERLDIDTFKENPKQVLCVLHARYEFAKFLVNYYEKHGAETICQNHRYPDKCQRYVRNDLANAKVALRQAENEIKMIEKYGQDDSGTQFTATLGKIKQLN